MLKRWTYPSAQPLTQRTCISVDPPRTSQVNRHTQRRWLDSQRPNGGTEAGSPAAGTLQVLRDDLQQPCPQPHLLLLRDLLVPQQSGHLDPQVRLLTAAPLVAGRELRGLHQVRLADRQDR